MISLRTWFEAGAALACIIAVPIIDHVAEQRGRHDEQVAQANTKPVAQPHFNGEGQ